MRIMKFFNDVLIFAKMNIKPNVRSYFTFLAILLVPFVPVFFIWLLGMNTLQGFAGALVMAITFTGLGIANDVVLYRKLYKLQDMFVASPVSPLAYVLGISLSSLILSLPSIATSLTILAIKLHLELIKIIEIIIVILLTWITITSLAFALATYIESLTHVSSLSSAMSIILGILPPVYYPIKLIPNPYRVIAYLAPTTHSAQLLRIILARRSFQTLEMQQFVHWLMLVAFTLFFILLVIKKAQWREK